MQGVIYMMKRINKERSIIAMSKNHSPALRINSGETVIFETYDCYYNMLKSESDSELDVSKSSGNPATGPLYVEGAETGDILKVEIQDIKVAPQGAMRIRPGVGIFGDHLKKCTVKIIPIRDNKAILNNEIQIPINPMIGVIGTAPEGEEVKTIVPGAHGGNLDCKRIVKGATVYLPVYTEGGLLSIGDLHAIMGDGETAICGLEIAGEVTVKVDVIKGKKLPLPMVVDGEHIMTISSKKTLDEASRQAAINMHRFLTDEVNLDVHEAAMLLSLVGDLKICQIVDPLMTSRMELPLWVLEKYNYKMV